MSEEQRRFFPPARNGCVWSFYAISVLYLIWVTLPTLIFCYRNSEFNKSHLLGTLIVLHVYLTMIVFPVALGLSLGILNMIAFEAVGVPYGVGQYVRRGIVRGMLMSICNFGAWLVGLSAVNGHLLTGIQLVMLIFLLGAITGAIAGYVAWRDLHPDKKRFPFHFSLQSLVIFVLILGAMMTVFRPESDQDRMRDVLNKIFD